MTRRLLVAAALVLSFVAGGWLLGPIWGRNPETYHQARLFDQVVATIHDEFVDSVNARELYLDAARGTVKSLHDPFAELLVGDRFREYHDQMTGTREVTGSLFGHSQPAGETVHIPAVSQAALVNGVGYLALGAVTEGAAGELQHSVDSLRARGMKRLVLDLRMNPGGLIQEGVSIASLFLPSGDTIATVRGRVPEHSEAYLARGPERWPGLGLTLLVDRGTASAAEMITAALQDHDRATVLGTRTYGKGVVQTTYQLDDQVAIKLTTARWYAPNGKSIQMYPEIDSAGTGGIIPDVKVRHTPLTAGDAALLQAIGEQRQQFDMVVARCAAELAASGAAPSKDFEVSAAMRERLYQRLFAAGIVRDRAVYDGATGWLDRELGAAVARAEFGPAAGLQRRAARDRQLAAALALHR